MNLGEIFLKIRSWIFGFFCLGLLPALAFAEGRYEVRGKVAVALKRAGVRELSGHFSQVRGDVRVPDGYLYGSGAGQVWIKLDSWQGRDPRSSQSLIEKLGKRSSRYGRMEILSLTGLDSARSALGGQGRGRLVGSIGFGANSRSIDLPVRVFYERGAFRVEPLEPLDLSLEQMGLAGKGGYDDGFRAYFRLILQQNQLGANDSHHLRAQRKF